MTVPWKDKQMAKYANDSVLDALLDKVATATQLVVTDAQPTTRANALSAALATATIDGSDFTKSDDATSGRKVTVAQQSTVPVTATGDASHVSLVDGTDLLWVTTATSQTVTDGNTLTLPAWNISVSDPS